MLTLKDKGIYIYVLADCTHILYIIFLYLSFFNVSPFHSVVFRLFNYVKFEIYISMRSLLKEL